MEWIAEEIKKTKGGQQTAQAPPKEKKASGGK
jgi:hypothetical protein